MKGEINMIHDDIKSVLISEDELKDTVKKLGARINRDYEGKEILLVAILKGSLVFAADLMREIELPIKLDFMQAASYGTKRISNGVINIKKDLENDAAGKNILIVEDIVDSGYTLHYLKPILASRNPASIEICTLLSKSSRREVDVDVKYVGMDIPDEFVVGYGLDFNERYRNLPYVGILKPEVYTTV